ncbi:MAG: pectin esterase [Uliginosibacterium sp.]|nr:pectin esterase [Uliginosibacterium sp.]
MNPNRRALLAVSSLSALSAALSGCASLMPASMDDDITVDPQHKGLPGERVNGRPTFKTIQGAVDALPAYATKPRRIFIRVGRYAEKLVVDKPFVSLLGENMRKTMLRFDAHAGQQKPDGSGILGTAGSAVLTVKARNFSAANLSIENGFDFPTNDAKDLKDPTRTDKPQAVAVLTTAGADQTLFQRVRIAGHQHTLLLQAGRALFEECRISGNVDFIAGAGQALFTSCELLTRTRAQQPGVEFATCITAPSTPIGNAWGFVFLGCKLTRDDPNQPARSCALGRPWHPPQDFADGRYANPNAIGSSVFIDCDMDAHILPEGWVKMAGVAKVGTAPVWFLPEDARLFEYRNKGPGAAAHPKRRQLTAVQAAEFARERLLEGWRL